MEKRRNCSLGAISPLFHNIFNISLTWESNERFILLKVVVGLIVFLSSANLICRSTDISKCFIESLGFRDNESRLYSAQLNLAFTLRVRQKKHEEQILIVLSRVDFTHMSTASQSNASASAGAGCAIIAASISSKQLALIISILPPSPSSAGVPRMVN